MGRPSTAGEIERLRQERDLYLRLLSLGSQSELEPFLEQSLALIVELTGARQGYLELGGDAAGSDDPAWWISHGCSTNEVEDIREVCSRGIIAEALATGLTVMTPSALLDPRFRSRASVQSKNIEAVVCAPIGGDTSLGVLYLQGGGDRGPFTEDDRANAEIFAQHLAPYADRLLVRRRLRDDEDPTRVLRSQLRLDGVIGRSHALAAVLQEAALVAPLEVNALITGESGTGKSQLARVIHDNGPRSAGPFVELNCAALPEALIESELFGAAAGAHSTARTAVEGKVAAARRGTLFLDEIGELPMASQAKLLQLLQSKRYYPLGATKPVDADVRVIAATNTDLADAVSDGRFRQDLYYRLEVLPIRMPSLSERRADLRELAAHFATATAKRNGLPSFELSAGAIVAIEAAEWPGNVRQLAHAVEAAAIRAAGQRAIRIEANHVFPKEGAVESTIEGEARTFQQATSHFQREFLQQALDATGWNVAETARRLDLARSHVYNLIKTFGLQRSREES